ncbi:Uncharacterised protein [Chryseobacterium taklimakanense]|uniref:Uncharacterized protein n=2 Tax=Chryseobacterium taklimakanense TaxID=536441 RepID=A0A239XKU5_9FLAO|nr:Uncharacterised protein [Chryseobacterium taklimakanense]
MQHLEEIRQKYFMECKKIISELLYTENAQDLADNKYQVDKLLEKVSFLKVMSEIPDLFSYQINDNQPVSERDEVFEFSTNEKSNFEEESNFEVDNNLELDEKLTETYESVEDSDEERETELAEIDNTVDNPAAEEEVITPSNENEENTVENLVTEELIEEAAMSEEAYQKSAELAETESDKFHETVETEKRVAEPGNSFFEESSHHPHKSEKKFKLPHIKGLKTVESLFDDNPLEHQPKHEDSGSLVKSNVSIDFMEAERPKHEFKLDLNDRIAFSKLLFNGSQSEMNDVVAQLNSFKTLDEAKEFLSDIYYRKNWKKVDEYAQRLWQLVENKFQ